MASPVAEKRRLGSRPLLIGGIAAAVIAADQITKSIALDALGGGRTIELVWTLRLALEFNSGGAFGLGRGFAPFFVAAGVALLALLMFAARRVATPLMGVALGLVLGGAIGNLGDRLFRGHGGAVVDFIDLQWWPVFNVADMAITSGAVLLLLASRGEHDDASP